MQKWIFDGGFIAHRMNDQGQPEVKEFTSTAQARQFVEKQNGDKTVHRQHKFSRQRAGRRIRSNSTVKTDRELTPEQKAIKAEALRQLKGL